MRISLGILATLLTMNTFASVKLYTIDTNQYMSPDQLASECAKDENEASAKLKVISERLLPGQDGVLSVSGTYGRISHRSGSSSFPVYSYEYYCVLDFKTKDPSIHFNAYSKAMLTRLSKENWELACLPAYTEAMSNPNSPFSVHWAGWTLLQGRYCEVTTVEVLK